MWKRFIYELKKSASFFMLLVLIGGICWLSLYNYINLTAPVFMMMGLSPLLIILLIMLLMVFFSIRFVVVNFSRELSAKEGLLTFLSPLSPLKIMLAKWLNLLFSFACTFIAIRLITMFLPLDPEMGAQAFLNTLETEGFVEAFFKSFIFMDPGLLVLFVLFWTHVLFLGYFSLLISRHIFLYRGKSFLMQLFRVIMIFTLIFAIGRLLSWAFAAYPLIWDTDTGSLILVSKYFRDGGQYFTLVQDFFAYASCDNPGNHFSYSGYSVVHMLAYILISGIFLFLSCKIWNKTDR